MTETPLDQRLAELIEAIAPRSRLTRVWELKGGVSAEVTALEIERPDGGRQRMVVRRHGEADLARNPRIASDEFKLLQGLVAVGLPAPRPLYLDDSGELLSTPFLVVEYIDGESGLTPADVSDCVRQLAGMLPRIHSLDRSALDLSFLPVQELGRLPGDIAESSRRGRIRDLLEGVTTLPRRNEAALLHGDFWPGNTLWREGRLVGVVDWEDAAAGDPLADVANARLELLWAFGPDAMRRFTDRYASGQAAVDLTDLPYWDVWAAARLGPRVDAWDLADATKRTMRDREELFVTQAVQALSSRG